MESTRFGGRTQITVLFGTNHSEPMNSGSYHVTWPGHQDDDETQKLTFRSSIRRALTAAQGRYGLVALHLFVLPCFLSLLNMALLQTSIVWVIFAIVVTILIAIASIFIYIYQTPRDRSLSVTVTCIFAITSLLATVVLLPADVALISSTVVPKLGRRKDWATQDEVDDITFSLTVVYYFLYSLDALLCLIFVPFTYFWYEEYDDLGEQTTGQRFWNSFKYTLSFIAIAVVLFLVGFFAPTPNGGDGLDLDYFRKLLIENRKYTASRALERYLFFSPMSADRNPHRRRTRPDIRTWPIDNHRDLRLCLVQLFRICTPPIKANKDRSVNFESSDNIYHVAPIRIEPRTTASIRRQM